MKKLVINFRGKELMTFESLWTLLSYILDFSTKSIVLSLIISLPILHEFIDTPSNVLARFTGIYIASIVAWGLLFVKSILLGKESFGKTRFDLGFMLILFFMLLGVLFSDQRVVGVFGKLNTWSYSIITFLSVSIVYYVSTLVFKYSRGVKWLSLGFVLSLLLGGIYSVYRITGNSETFRSNYLEYAVLSIPLLIGMFFLFRKLFLRILVLIVFFLNLGIVCYYSTFLRGSMFILSVGVLALFIIFYFSFWVKNAVIVLNFLKKLAFDVKNFGQILKKSRKEMMIFILMIFMAGWILGFGAFSLDYYKSNVAPYLVGWVSEGIEDMKGASIWLIGENDLSEHFSGIEALNILNNYGVFAFSGFILLFLSTIYMSAKLTLHFLYKGSFRNIILLASIFITLFTLLASFLLTRFNPLTYLLLIIVFSIYAIIEDIFNGRDLYKLEKLTKTYSKVQIIVRAILISLVIVVFVAGIIGILNGVNQGLFN